jgi:hypothetical protein
MIAGKSWKLLFMCLFGGLLTSCSNDFELTEGTVDLPVVYGMISVGDSATYIRVEKAFIDEETSAIQLAKDPANLYYNDIEVVLVHEKTGRQSVLQRVDGNLEGYKRDQGAFADMPNYLYKIRKGNLNFIPKDAYTLLVRKKDGTLLTKATVVAIAPYANEDITNPGPTALLSFNNLLDFKVRWFGDPAGVIHDVAFTFNVKEEKAGKVTDKSVTWKVAENLEKTEYTFKGRAFYEFMQGAFEKDPAVKRYFQSASLTIVSGGQAIKDYISIGQANLGITSSGEIPRYSNLSNGALGLFSSKTTFTRPDIGLANVTLDSLRNGVVTKSLNFQ